MNAQSSEQILNNRLRVKTSIDIVRWFAFQGCAFRGYDETLDSKNRANFMEMLKLLASYNDKVGKLVLENAPKSSKNKIHEDVGDSRFCIIVDEARDEFKKEQMAIILRFVDVDGFMQKRFFDLVHVKDTLALTLKNEIFTVLYHHCLDIQNIRGQGYDGASSMCGEWNELQLLFLKDCPYAYYVYCFAHRLQLALVAVSIKVVSVHEFFSNLNFIINVQKSQDILNAMNIVSTIKGLIQKLRHEGWKNLVENVVSFFKKFDIDISELSYRYVQDRGHYPRDHITIEHHYHFEIFNATIDFQMQELDNMFGEGTTRLLTFSSTLNPKDEYKSFNIDDICCLVKNYYPLDFSENEKINLRFQLKHFEVDVFSNLMFQDLRSITDLSFSAMKIVKTRLRNKIEDKFIANNLVVYIEREIAKNFDLD
ncbi:hypothetical protein CIPAW_05G235700 [Carya illinoinensis]|uniref:DUF4371 domain-containing protein n=1 Tax=Carya illinoinensis TaxID=32201 RepID=A0A8T1QNN5_CARIL|nr:hypothetical protein CIPAW_05G235700 [Carya illinoinensis]